MASQQERAAAKELDEILAELPGLDSKTAAWTAHDLAVPELEQIEDPSLRACYIQAISDAVPQLSVDELTERLPQIERYLRDGTETHNLADGNGDEASEGSGVSVPSQPTWEPFPTSVLPEPLKTYVPEVAKAIGCDDSFIAVASLVTLAGAVGNRRRVRVRSSWTEPFVLWGALVAPSGTQKSPAMAEVVGPLSRDDQQKIKTHQQFYEAYEIELDHWKSLENEKARRKSYPDGKPTPPTPCARTVVSDITVEALAVVHEYSPGGLLLHRDELGAFINGFDRYNSGGGDAPNWLSMHSAKPVTVDRKGTQKKGELTLVPRAAVSILGTIQPVALQRALKVGGSNEHVENGLAARFLFAMPPSRLRTWTDDDISDTTRTTWTNLLRDLTELQFADDDHTPVDLTLDDGARAACKAHVNAGGIRMQDQDDTMRAATSKLEGGACRLAGIFALVKDPNAKSVDAFSMGAGVLVAEWFTNEAERLYSMFAEGDAGRERETLIAFLKRHGPCTSRELGRGLRQYRRDGKATMALYELQKDKLGEFRDRGGKGSGKPGKPTREFVLFGTGQ